LFANTLFLDLGCCLFLGFCLFLGCTLQIVVLVCCTRCCSLVFVEFLGLLFLDAVLSTACNLEWDILVAWDCEALIDAQALLSDLAAHEAWLEGDHVASALVLVVEDEAAGCLASLLAPDGLHAARVFASLQVDAVGNGNSLAAECHF